jgi:hypothetical protein
MEAYVLPKRWKNPTRLHGNTCQKKEVCIVTAVRTSNLAGIGAVCLPKTLKIKLYIKKKFPAIFWKQQQT